MDETAGSGPSASAPPTTAPLATAPGTTPNKLLGIVQQLAPSTDAAWRLFGLSRNPLLGDGPLPPPPPRTEADYARLAQRLFAAMLEDLGAARAKGVWTKAGSRKRGPARGAQRRYVELDDRLLCAFDMARDGQFNGELGDDAPTVARDVLARRLAEKVFGDQGNKAGASPEAIKVRLVRLLVARDGKRGAAR